MYHAPYLTSEVMAFAQEHEKAMQHAEELNQLLATLDSITAPQEQSQRIVGLLEVEQKINKELEPHFYNEEEALFPVLGRHIGFERGIIPDILAEHEQLRNLFQQLQQSISSLKDSWTNDHVEQLNGAAKNFVTFISEHIEKEDHTLFPLMEKKLSLEEKREVYFHLYANVKAKQ